MLLMVLKPSIDFGKLKCSAFIELDAQTMTMFYFWLDGYASTKTGDTKLDAGAVENNLTLDHEGLPEEPQQERAFDCCRLE